MPKYPKTERNEPKMEMGGFLKGPRPFFLGSKCPPNWEK